MSLIYTSPTLTQPGKTGRHCVYLGGKEDAKDKKKLLSLGISHILNVTPAKEANIQAGVPNYFEKMTKTFTYKRIPVYDAPTSDLLQYADATVSFISTGLHHGSVLVHCQRGVSRSATCIIFFLMRRAGMRFDNAIELCKSNRPIVNPISAFVRQLQDYEKKCIRIGAIASPTKSHPDNKDKEESSRSKPEKRKRREHETNIEKQRSTKRIIGPSLADVK